MNGSSKSRKHVMLLLINDNDAGHKGNEYTNYNKNKKECMVVYTEMEAEIIKLLIPETDVIFIRFVALARSMMRLQSSHTCCYCYQILRWCPDIGGEGRRLPPTKSLNKRITKSCPCCSGSCANSEAVSCTLRGVNTCL